MWTLHWLRLIEHDQRDSPTDEAASSLPWLGQISKSVYALSQHLPSMIRLLLGPVGKHIGLRQVCDISKPSVFDLYLYPN